ncbi:MAG: FAD-binding oxidoreductase [Acidobacteriota bacterium]|nr:FAD-binding oxidoreductase [Acidobacteriota bacterium]
MDTRSWGRYPRQEQKIHPVFWRHLPLPKPAGSMLPHGLGRSYGDSCQNEGGTLLLTTGMNRLVSFDAEEGLLCCEAGISLSDILDFIVPRGWFLPVTPGTRFVTLGGAIANDVHGKNHHRDGSFGCHVTRFELLRSDGSRRLCSAAENPEWFRATIGGMGLTGLITRAEIRLLKIDNPFIEVENIKFNNLEGFAGLARESDENYAYTVSWIDTSAPGRKRGRGIFMRGNHAGSQYNHRRRKPPRAKAFPVEAPEFLINPLTVKWFNTAYYHKQLRRRVAGVVDYEPYFYPLDAVLHWNRAYGRRGFLQYQCIVPDLGTVAAILDKTAQHGQNSFLTVLKVFGSKPSPGLMSFPREGLTLTMDFPVSARVTAMCDDLDVIVADAGGSLYPAKDARMPAALFQQFFPRFKEFEAYLDPAFSSSFWRRVTARQETSDA